MGANVTENNELFAAAFTAVGTALAALLAHKRAMRQQGVANAATTVETEVRAVDVNRAQAELSHFLTTELTKCHELHASLRQEMDERTERSRHEREELRDALAELRTELDLRTKK